MRPPRPPLVAAAFCALAFAAPICALPAGAAPLVYTATVATNVKVGTTMYPDALLTIRFVGDPKDTVPVPDGTGKPLPSALCLNGNADGSGFFYMLAKGTATASVTSHGKTILAKINPGQVFVALDSCNGGIGFGSIIDNNPEPAYPLGYTIGTAMAAAATGPGYAALSTPVSVSGNAFSCIGYPPSSVGNLPGSPNGCGSPDAHGPLQTNQGPLYVYQSFPATICPDCNHLGTLNRGTFTIAPLSDE